MNTYEKNILNRSWYAYTKGLIARWLSHIKYAYTINMIRIRGGICGDECSINPRLAMLSSKNLIIGNHVVIQTSDIDTRSSVVIGNHVIIGQGVKIITNSHDIDDLDFSLKKYGIEIEDYVWIATNATILPSCRKIGRGAVVGAGSVVTKDVPPMAVVSGNPAQILRHRNNCHYDLVVESLNGGDYIAYKKARMQLQR